MAGQDPYKITRDTYNKIAQVYQDVFMELDLYNDTYDLFCELVTEPHAAVFEIGCGPGNVTRYLHQKRPDLVIDAIDSAPGMIDLASKNNPGVSFSVMDCRDISRVDKKYSGIISGFCVPYLSKEDCAALISECDRLLLPGGVLYLSMIEGNYAGSGYVKGRSGDSVYVYYHELPWFEQELRQNGFELLHTLRKEFKRPAGTEIHLILIARK